MRTLLRSVIRCCGLYQQHRLEKNCSDPVGVQENLLRHLLNDNADTLFGQDHGFAGLKTIDEYKARVPVRDYEGHRPYVDQIISGNRTALTRDPPFMFNTTSGTTGAPKYIPWNGGIDGACRALTRLWIYRCLKDHPGILDHRIFCLVSPAEEGVIGGLPFGSASGHIQRTVPAAIRRHYALPYPVSEIDDYDTRYFVALRLAMEQRVSVISTANPATLVRLAEAGSNHAERLIRAIHDGTLGTPMGSQPEIRKQLEGRLAPNPGRARALESLAGSRGSLRPRDYWPDLKLVGCWTGGSIGARAGDIAPHYGNVPLRDLGYLASEARMSLPVADHEAEGILSLSTSFYEFIPEAEADAQCPATLLCHELEVGGRYHILLTTPGGLYRYDINDVVEVTGFHGRCPMIVFVRKGRDMTSITGEKLHVNHCLAAMHAVEQRHGSFFTQFRFVPDPDECRYQVFIEPPRSGAPICHSIAASIDAALCEQNMEYAQKRRSLRLASPVLQVMRKGWFENEVRTAGYGGRRHAEFKWRHLLPAPQAGDAAWMDTQRQGVEGRRVA